MLKLSATVFTALILSFPAHAQDCADYSLLNPILATLCDTDSIPIQGIDATMSEDPFEWTRVAWPDGYIAMLANSNLTVYPEDVTGTATPLYSYGAPPSYSMESIGRFVLFASEFGVFLYEVVDGQGIVEAGLIDFVGLGMYLNGESLLLTSNLFDTVRSYDLSDPYAPVLQWEVGFPQDLLSIAVNIDESTIAIIYDIGQEQCALGVVDISDPENPSTIGQVELGWCQEMQWPRSISILNGFVCTLVGGESYVVDVHNPTEPTQVPLNNVFYNENPSLVTVIDSMFVVSSERLERFDTTRPEGGMRGLDNHHWTVFSGANGRLVGSRGVSGECRLYGWDKNPESFQVGDALHIQPGARDFEVSNGVVVSSYPFALYPAPYTGENWMVEVPGSVVGQALEVVDNYVIISVPIEGGIAVYDIANTFDPIRVAFLPAPGIHLDMEMYGDLAVVADSLCGIHIVDYADIENPEYGGFVSTTSPAYRVEASSGVAFAATGSNEVVFFDISDPLQPVYQSSLVIGDQVEDIASYGNIAYIVSTDDDIGLLYVANFGVSTTPEILGQYQVPGTPTCIVANYPYLYIGLEGLGIQVFSITNWVVPQYVGGELLPGHAEMGYFFGSPVYRDIKALRIGDGYLFSWWGWDYAPFDDTILNYPLQCEGGTQVLELDPLVNQLWPSSFPNPFNPSTTICFTLPVASEVTLSVYDLAGRRILDLHSGEMDQGSHEVQWHGVDFRGTPVTSGIYLYRLEAGERVVTRKMTLLK